MKYVTLCAISYQWRYFRRRVHSRDGWGSYLSREGNFMAKAWKKLPILALAAALAAMVAMVGCSSEQKSEEATDEKAATETTAEPVELQVFAANSLSKAMEEVQAAYIEDGHSNVTFADTQYKSSGELNEMLGAGSYADLLISASKGSMDTAVKEGYVNEGTRVDMFKNDLVIVSKEGSGLKDVTLQDIADGKYTFCVGDESVPAGNYADQALSTVGVYVPSGDDEGKTGKDISGKNGAFAEGYNPVLDTSVGNVCKHAQSGDVDVAFVYTSDVYRFGGVEIVGTVPADTHKNIVYPGAITSQSKNVEATQEFLDWCQNSEKAQEIWQKWGFELA